MPKIFVKEVHRNKIEIIISEVLDDTGGFPVVEMRNVFSKKRKMQ